MAKNNDLRLYIPASTDVQSLTDDDSYSESTARTSLLHPNQHVERRSTPQRLVQYSILLFEVFRSTASEAYTLWIPISMHLSKAFFADHDEFSSYKLRWSLIPVLCYLVRYGLCLPVGLLTDSLPVRKGTILLFITPIAFALHYYMVYILSAMGDSISCISNITDYNDNHTICTVNRTEAYGNDVHSFISSYEITAILLSVFGAFLVTIPPVLGGSQCQNREAVRDYYAKFYLADRTGTVIAGMGVITLHFFKDPWIVGLWYSKAFKLWALFVAIPGAVGYIMLFFALGVTVCCGVSRGLGDLVVITDTYKIFRQAFSRTRLRIKGDGLLEMAKLSRGGDFADGSVNDRRKIVLLAMLSACVAPATFAMFSTHDTAPNVIPQNISSETYVEFDPIRKVVFFSVEYGGAISALACLWVARRCRGRQSYSPLTRWQVGQAFMVAVTIVSIILDKVFSGNIISFYSLFAVKFLLGVSDALIYTTGYKLTLLAAPQSMQTVSYGMFKGVLLFLANLITLGFIYGPLGLQWVMEISITLAASIGFIFLFLMKRYVDLGFNFV